MVRPMRALSTSYFCLLMLAFGLAACQTTPTPQASITNAVTSKGVKGETFEAEGITDTYPADQPKFHVVVSIANAPSGTLLKAVWTAVDVGAAAAPNTKLDETEIKVQGTRNVDFPLEPQEGRWPPGSYKVEIHLNGTLERTLKFTVAGPPATPTPEPTSIPPTATIAPTATAELAGSLCPPLSPLVAKPTGIVSNVTLARDTRGNTKEPVDPTVTFAGNAVFHAIVAIQNAPANTSFRASWYATDAMPAATCNQLLDSSSTSSYGTRNIDFALAPTAVWPAGRYRVEIYVNEVLDRWVAFEVSGQSAISTPTATRRPITAVPTTGPATNTPTATATGSTTTATAVATTVGAPPVVTATNTPRPTPRPTTRPSATATSTADPNPCKLAPGNAGLLVINNFDAEMTLTIVDHEYHIPGHNRQVVQFPGGKPITINAFILGVGRDLSGPFTYNAGECRIYEPHN